MFYKEFSNYYDSIYPMNSETLSFLKESFKFKKKLLDAACKTGELAIALTKEGHEVQAIDIDKHFVKVAKDKANYYDGLDLKFRDTTLLTLGKDDNLNYYDGIYYLHDEISFLESGRDTRTALKHVHKILNNEGVFVLETLNFDKIINEEITILGNEYIEDKNIRLTTELERDGEYINCINKLQIKGKEFSNEELLIPLISDDIIEFLSSIGFRKIRTFGDYDGSDFDKENSIRLIIKCEK
ncbi:MAG: class I SAM-dependent methyltransferase [Clostridium sp.]|uniref:class I SAM-dependent methyltransferase n=1 Tax=Clostridium sp. TaxID=1506 RepID=UPI003F3B0308